MAKPDLQKAYITASGTAFRLKGKLGLEDKGPITGLDLLEREFDGDSLAAAGGVELGELYHFAGDVFIRLT